MNTKVACICLLVCFVAMTHAQDYGRTRGGGGGGGGVRPSVYCYDYQGQPIVPGQRYCDGYNWCECGYNGQPRDCTLQACGQQIYRPPAY
ncbi:hypothetical protein DPMN_108236 [Dreissena polymorpha]|uniref:Pacifastin domain-containing protein n=1 Tax=Dreissena polymorpha TaxID=45954 RepID=A0A9D4K8E5_DREPO|nr:hypothetical protein DPMN_108236 [Dreissena polymorpha]